MKFYILFFFILLGNFCNAKIEYFPHNFFNFYRKSLDFNFTINSDLDKIDIFHRKNSFDNKRSVGLNFFKGNYYFYMELPSTIPNFYYKNDSAKENSKLFGGRITYSLQDSGIQGKGDVYLMMFRLNPDSSRNYGWLKFNISADCDSLYFISSGFNTIINDPVVAGEGEWVLSKPYFNPDFKLYPNPSSAFQLEIPESYFNSNIIIEIMDLNGKIIHKNPYQNQPFSLPIPNGLYWVIIRNENEILSQIRWVKE